MYCGPRCKVSAWRLANPEANQAHRVAQAVSDKARRAAARRDKPKRPERFSDCKHCGVRFKGGAQACEPCRKAITSEINKKRFAEKMKAKIAQRPSQVCPECGTDFVPAHAARAYCSHVCMRRSVSRAVKGIREARMRGVASERVNPIKVFERDGWRCHICARKTPRQLRGTYKPNAPELDHIVPLAAGGAHTYRNTACSCRQCNGKKGAQTYGQPSLLALAV